MQRNLLSKYCTLADLGEPERAGIKNSSFNERHVVEMTTKERLQLDGRLIPV